MQKHVILVSGWRGSGKTHFCRQLADVCGAYHIEFADALKKQVAAKYDLDAADMQDKNRLLWPVMFTDAFARQAIQLILKECRPLKEYVLGKTFSSLCKDYWFEPNEGKVYLCRDQCFYPLHWTVRALLIFEGSITRTILPDYWVRITCKRVEEALNKNCEWAVIGGFRYRAEAAAVRQYFSQYADVNIHTVRINRFDEHPDNSVDPSERDLDIAAFDTVIENRGSLTDYDGDICAFISLLNVD